MGEEKIDDSDSDINSSVDEDEVIHSTPNNGEKNCALRRFLEMDQNIGLTNEGKIDKKKQKTKKTKKNSKYIGKNEDFRLRQSQLVNGKKKVKAKHLRNARSLAARSLLEIDENNQKKKKTTYIIEDSSVIDVIIELLSFSYRKYKSFVKFLDLLLSDSCELNFVKAIVDWAKTFNTSTMYKLRAEAMGLYAKKVENTIINVDNVGDFFKKLFLENSRFYSCLKTVNCEECGLQKSDTIQTIHLSLATVQDLLEVKECIENYLIEYNFEEHQNCPSCLRYAWYDFGEAIIIDLEDSKLNMTLDFFPKYLTFEEETYVLSGEISSKPSMKEPGRKHYVAYTSDPNGSWQEINNSARKIMVPITKLVKVNMAIVLYLKANNNQN